MSFLLFFSELNFLMTTCTQYTAITTFIVTFIASFYSLLMEHTSLHLSHSSVSSSMFGWIDPFWRIKLILFGFLNGVICQAGFNFAVGALSMTHLI
jgi:hypothetical protein